ncbi:MAG: hypothetical protein R3A45_00620 [Bdellovibrionota bacterium]
MYLIYGYNFSFSNGIHGIEKFSKKGYTIAYYRIERNPQVKEIAINLVAKYGEDFTAGILISGHDNGKN